MLESADTLHAPRPRARFVAAVVFLIVLPGLLIFITPIAPRNDLLWDFAMGAGFVATALMFVLPVLSTRIWFSYNGDAREVVDVLFAHRFVSYLALLLLAMHIVLLLVIDTTVIEYLKLSAPWPMLAAIVATLAYVVIIVQSEFRLRLNMRYHRWRYWHGALSMLCILGAAYHIVAAHYYVNSVAKLVVFGMLGLFFSAGIYLSKRKYRQVESLPRLAERDRSLIFRMAVYAALFVLAVLFIYSIPPPGNRTENQAIQCVIDDC